MDVGKEIKIKTYYGPLECSARLVGDRLNFDVHMQFHDLNALSGNVSLPLVNRTKNSLEEYEDYE